MNKDSISGYMPGDECSVCKGRCCKERGCSLSPEDLTEEQRIALEKVSSAVEFLNDPSCLYAIDGAYSEGGTFYYLRMRTKCYTFIGIEGFGECIALTENGCSLEFESRPKGGRSLMSSSDFRCHQEYVPMEMQKDWAPYQEVLAAVWKEYSEKLEQDGTIEACEREYEKLIRSRMKIV